MSNYHFGDDYDLNYYPQEASDSMGGVDWDKVESVEIECVDFVRKPDDKSRWYELFGTPEMAARTLVDVASRCDANQYAHCDDCPLFDVCEYDCNVLEWLRGDEE